MARISFYCVICGNALTADSLAGGEITECPRCLRQVPVPKYPLQAGQAGCAPAFPPEILSLDLNFLCPGCRVQLIVDARTEGRELACPRCEAEVTVPRWSGRASEQPVIAATGPPAVRTSLTPEEISFLSGDFSHA